MSLAPPDDWDAFALAKVARLLGPAQGERVHRATLAKLGRRLASADDLVAYARVLGSEGGFVAALAAMLRLDAVMRGAADPPNGTE